MSQAMTAMGLALEWAVGPCGGLGALGLNQPTAKAGRGLGWSNGAPWGRPAALGWTCSTWAPPDCCPDPHNCMRRWELDEEGVTETPGGMLLPFHICVSAPLLCAPLFSVPHTALEAWSTRQATPSSWVWNGPRKVPCALLGAWALQVSKVWVNPAAGIRLPLALAVSAHEPGVSLLLLPSSKGLGQGVATSLDATAGLLCDPMVLS